MGDGGERLHDWAFPEGQGSEIDAATHREAGAAVGATVVGRRTFDVGQGPWGGTPFPGTPGYVMTHRPGPDLLGGNGGTFAFGGPHESVERARKAAEDKDVFVMGADVSRQVLAAGLLDEVHLHLVPILLGAGTPLFAGERAESTLAGRRSLEP
jgi:dihydrofolate reductase